MADRALYNFGAAPLQDPIVGKFYLTDPWRNWFVDLQRQFLVRWDDLQFPAQGINLSGGAADPGVDTTTGLLVFSGIADNMIGGVAKLSHQWLPGSVVRPYVNLRFPTSAAANTRWQFDYDIANENGAFIAAAGTYSSLTVITVANPQNVLSSVVADFGDLPMVGFREGTDIMWRLWRLAASDAADTDITDAHLMGLGFNFRKNKAGTVPERA